MLQRALHNGCARCSSAAALRVREPWKQIAGDGCLPAMRITSISHSSLMVQFSSGKREKLGLSCAATARQRVQKGAHLHAQRHSICAAASQATSQHAQCRDASEEVECGSFSAAGQGYSHAGADGLDQRLVRADGSGAQPASSELHSTGTVHSIELPNGRHRFRDMPKQPKKVIPWPTAIRASEPLPADPLTWQNAAVLIDKPLGWTSFDVCAKLRAALRIKKVYAWMLHLANPWCLHVDRTLLLSGASSCTFHLQAQSVTR